MPRGKKVVKPLNVMSGWLARDPRGVHLFAKEPKLHVTGIFGSKRGRTKIIKSWSAKDFVKARGGRMLPKPGECFKATVTE
jgi:hypothetical protein